jgi:arabinofuranan 3-O-arabinosyltransferase
VLVLSHNANPGWVATDGHGQALASVRVNGWQQGWVLPAGAATEVHMRYDPQRWYAAGLVVGAVAFLALLVLWLLTTRSRAKPRNEIAEPDGGSVQLSGALPGSASGGWLLAVLLVVTFPVNAGLVGVLAVVIGAVVGCVGRRWPRLGVTLVGVLAAAAVAAVAAAPWGEGGAALMSVGVQQLVLAAFAGMAASGAPGAVLPRWVPSAGRPRRVSAPGGAPSA